jgi:hypothetical protein
MSLILDGTNGLSDVDGTAAAPAIRGTDANTGIFFPAADTIAFAEGGAEVARFDSAGNFGLGNTAPSVNFEIGSNTSTVRVLAVRYSSIPAYLSSSYDGTFGLSTFSTNNYNTSNGSSSFSSFSNVNFGSSAVQLAAGTGGADIRFLTAAAANTNPSERARIDSSGNLLVGATTASGKFTLIVGSGQVGYYTNKSSAGGGLDHAQYYTDGGLQGKITQTGAFTTVSDYRIKNAVTSLSGMLEKVCKLKPVSYTLTAFNQQQIGFVAHELQQEFPLLVDGTKDAVNEDGSFALQSVDYPKMVAVLTAAIQEQQALITALTTRITALEAA